MRSTTNRGRKRRQLLLRVRTTKPSSLFLTRLANVPHLKNGKKRCSVTLTTRRYHQTNQRKASWASSVNLRRNPRTRSLGKRLGRDSRMRIPSRRDMIKVCPQTSWVAATKQVSTTSQALRGRGIGLGPSLVRALLG